MCVDECWTDTVDSVVRGRAMTQHYSVSRLYVHFRRFNHAQILEPKKWAEKYREKKNHRVSQTTTKKKFLSPQQVIIFDPSSTQKLLFF